MDKTVIEFYKTSIINGLSKCTRSQMDLFRRMYGYGMNVDCDIKDVVMNISQEKLDWALQQVNATIKGNEVNIK